MQWYQDMLDTFYNAGGGGPPPLCVAAAGRASAAAPPRGPPRTHGAPCGATIDARRTGARTGRAPVHSAQPADHVPCIAVRPRRAPGAPPW